MMNNTSPTKKIIVYFFLVLGMIISILPFYWMVIGSTNPTGKIFSVPPNFLPGNYLSENTDSLMEALNFPRILWNSLFVSLTTTVLSVLICSMAGYAFAKFKFKGKNTIFFIILCTLMIPFQVMLIPLFEIIVQLDWLNTYKAIILPTLASPFAIFLIRQNLMAVPDSILDSARIDGAGEFRIFFTIVIPTMKPALAAVSIFTFMGQWNSLLWPLITLNSKEMFTLPVALSSLVGLARIDYGQLMLGTTLSILPVLIFFFIFQKHFVSGILGGAVKE